MANITGNDLVGESLKRIGVKDMFFIMGGPINDTLLAAIKRGVPIVATRTSTHAFSGIPKDSPFASYNWNNEGGFGRKVLGETWVSHWGNHKSEATRTAVEPGAEKIGRAHV